MNQQSARQHRNIQSKLTIRVFPIGIAHGIGLDQRVRQAPGWWDLSDQSIRGDFSPTWTIETKYVVSLLAGILPSKLSIDTNFELWKRFQRRKLG